MECFCDYKLCLVFKMVQSQQCCKQYHIGLCQKYLLDNFHGVVKIRQPFKLYKII